MESHQNNHSFNAQTYIALFAEDIIDFINHAADDNVNNLFENGNSNRFQLSKDHVLYMVLSDRSLLQDLQTKLKHWKLVVSENAINITRLAFRTYYFAPIAAHPKWQTFLAKHPDISQSIIDKISAAFFYWILQPWTDAQADPIGVRKSIQPLIKIINSDSSNAALCKEFENNMIIALKDELNGFFLNFIDFTGKKEDIIAQVKNKLIDLEELHRPQFENIKMILWKRIEGFLESKMSVTVNGYKAEPPKDREITKNSLAHETKNHLKRDIKNEIAKGILEYFNSQTTEEERASDKHHITLTNIFNALFLQVSKDKHKKYESLFMYVPEHMHDAYSSMQEKRDVYSKQRSGPISQSVSNFSSTPKNQLVETRRSLKVSSSTDDNYVSTPIDADKNKSVRTKNLLRKISATVTASIDEDNARVNKLLSEAYIDTKEHVKVSVRRISTHHRRESFFIAPTVIAEKVEPEKNEAGGNDHSPRNNQ